MWIFALAVMAADYRLSEDPISQSPEVTSSSESVPARPSPDVEVKFDTTGKYLGCTIKKSSGSEDHDKQACDLLRKDIESQRRRGTLIVSEGGNGWHADIVDLTDPAHPTCTSKSEGTSAGSPGCAALLKQPGISSLGQQAKQIVFFISVAQGDDQPYEGDPQWGVRISNAVTNDYTLNGSSECVPLSFEPGHNPCDKFGTAFKFTDEDRKKAHKRTVQETLFALPRAH